MIATLSAQPIRMSHRQHYANASAAPLPIMPRRASSSRPLTSSPSTAAPKPSSVTPSPAMRRSYSSESDSEATPTQSAVAPQGPLTIRARRVRSAQAQGRVPAELSKAIPPLSRPRIDTTSSQLGSFRASQTEDNITIASQKSSLLYSPGMALRLGFERSRSVDGSQSAPGSAIDDSRTIRKKSGQLVKPSLKSSRSTTSEAGLSMFSKSEPATPVCKAVHFDSQLEHVKLFLAEQKPLAVSRDGSPTDDTSGTDSDFPSFIFGSESDKRDRRKLFLRVVNMPSQVNHRAEICLEEVSLSSGNHSILGRVRVRNIAYAKSVAVRFTFDSWQTTSEVIAHYHDSPSPNFDRFGFTIKLDDLLARIDDKTLVFALRYSVAGQEYWDNNFGCDYVARFSRSTPRDRSLSDDESPENLISLQNKLERVFEGKERAGPASSTVRTSPRSSPESEEPTRKSNSSLGARYDLDASIKQPWRYQEAPATTGHRRNNSFPQFIAPKPTLADIVPTLPSPREASNGVVPTTSVTSHIDGLPFEAPSPQGRNHRRGYFDFSTFGAVNVRRTPPTSPQPVVTSPSSGNTSPFGTVYPFPPLNLAQTISSRPPPLDTGLFSLDTDFDSELSTPSLMTPTSSRSTTPSPTDECKTLPSLSDDESPVHPDPQYRDLINQYCFFTGGIQDAEKLDFSPTQGLREAELPAADSTPKNHFDPRMSSISPMCSTDDLLCMTSGSLTPTNSRLNLLDDSRSPTPTACAS